jgi:hypothetical protein
VVRHTFIVLCCTHGIEPTAHECSTVPTLSRLISAGIAYWQACAPCLSIRSFRHGMVKFMGLTAITRQNGVRRVLRPSPMRLWLSLSSLARFGNVAASPDDMRGPRADGVAGGHVGR